MLKNLFNQTYVVLTESEDTDTGETYFKHHFMTNIFREKVKGGKCGIKIEVKVHEEHRKYFWSKCF